jgi:hypothetical protein
LAVVGHKFGNSHKEPYVDDTHMINFSWKWKKGSIRRLLKPPYKNS